MEEHPQRSPEIWNRLVTVRDCTPVTVRLLKERMRARIGCSRISGELVHRYTENRPRPATRKGSFSQRHRLSAFDTLSICRCSSRLFKIDRAQSGRHICLRLQIHFRRPSVLPPRRSCHSKLKTERLLLDRG